MGIDVSCQTDPELSPEKEIKYRKMKRKLATLIQRQKQLKGLLSAAQRRKFALVDIKKDTKNNAKEDPMEISDNEEENKLEEKLEKSEGSEQEDPSGGDV
ncbi:hypothetical protein G6F56_009333 [Rhizopus delemar]|nr:hypothetical protein G6F56_009333 [Rhizopus delemar]